LHILQSAHSTGGPHWKGSTVFLDKARDVGIIIHRSLDHGKAFRPQILFNATQDLSGSLAVWSSSENENQAQDLALVIAHFGLLAACELNDEVRGLPRNLSCKGKSYQRGQRNDYFRAHDEL
jgi:hypothetical protein